MESFGRLLLLKLFIINYSRVNLHTSPTLVAKQQSTHTTIEQAITLSPQGIESALFFRFE
jgi:hypothetical protein